MGRFKRTLLAAALAATSLPAAAQWSNMYFFGDSSTDAGTFGGARFTVNPGLVWAQDLGLRYGFTITPATTGGTDFAQGGARVTQLPGYPPTPPFATAVPLSGQISALLGMSPALDSSALYAVSIGYNDLFYAVAGVATGQIGQTEAQARVSQAAVQEAQQIAKLNAAGARYVVVFNIYDTARSPDGVAAGPVAQAGISALTSLYNTTLFAALQSMGIGVIPANTNLLFSEMLANPAFFGFTNVTARACGAVDTPLCTTADLVAPNAAQTYLFADGHHPTPAGYAIMAQVVASMLEGPQQMAVLPEVPLATERANFRAIDGRMQSTVGTPVGREKFNAWVVYDYANPDIRTDSPFVSGNANQNTIVAGLDYKASDRLVVGGAFTYSENKGDFSNDGGSYKLREPMGTAYVGYGMGPWYVGATLGGGSLDYDDITRNIALGPSTRTETARTTGYHYFGSILGGYWFNLGQTWIHGPFARVGYEKVVVRSFAENGSDSTALRYEQQKTESVPVSVGWQVAGQFGSVRPFARVTWEYDGKSANDSVNASSVTLGGSYSVPSPIKRDDNYALFNVGLATDFGKVTGFVNGAASAGKDDGEYWAVTVGLRVPL